MCNKLIYNISILGSFLMLFSFKILANGAEENAKMHSDSCVKACDTYFKKNNTLDKFSYYKTHGGVATMLSQAQKKAFCQLSELSLNQCYANESSLYNICKWGARGVASLISTDLANQLASCKDACLYDLRKFCQE